MELDAKNRIAKRVAQEFNDGDVVNLGIGVPTLATNYVPEGVNVIFQAENGIVGIGGKPARSIQGVGNAGASIELNDGGRRDSAGNVHHDELACVRIFNRTFGPIAP